MNDQITTFINPVDLFENNDIYVLLSEDENEWLECSVYDLFIVKDNVDLAAAVVLQLERYGYKLYQKQSFNLEQVAKTAILVNVNFREQLFPDRTGTIVFRLFPIKTAKEFLPQP